MAETDVLGLPELTADVLQARAAVDAARARPEYDQFARTRERLARQQEVATAQDQPRISAFARVGYGRPGLNFISDQFESEPASWAARHEAPEQQQHQPLAAYGGVISLIPNEAAVLQAMTVAGFQHVRRLTPNESHNQQYRAGNRGVFVGA